jgi:DNA-binding NarL/FixJ family response regulator
MDDDEAVVARALRAGAAGYVLKRTDPDDVVRALHTVWRGGLVLGPQVAQAALRALRGGPTPLPAPFDRLTDRELQIVVQIAAGRSNAQAARSLGISEKTVRNQLTPILLKLGVTDRVQAALLVREAGIRAPQSG